VLIEKTRSVVSDSAGQYSYDRSTCGPASTQSRFVDRFSDAEARRRRPADQLHLDHQRRIESGVAPESVTVTGQSPVVDVQSAASRTVLSRDTLDSIPTGRTIQSVGQLVVGVTLNVPDVGGSRAMQQTYMSVARPERLASHDAGGQHDRERASMGTAPCRTTSTNMMSQEMSYQTAGAGADVSAAACV